MLNSAIKEKRKTKDTLLLFFVVLIIEVLCHCFRHLFNTDWICISAFIVFYGVLFLNYTNWFLKYFRIVFWCVACLAGVVICENVSNFYLYELVTYTEHYGSLPLCIIFFTIVHMVLLASDRKFQYIPTGEEEKRDEFYIGKLSINGLIEKFIKPFMFLFGLVLFLIVLPNPSFLHSMDRFAYQRQFMAGWKWANGLYLIFVPLLLIPIFKKRSNKLTSVVFLREILFPLTPFLLYCIWIGEKFGVFFQIFWALSVPLICRFGVVIKDKKRLVKWFGLLFLFLTIFLYLYYSFRSMDLGEAVYARMSQQGQLWWKIFGTYESQSSAFPEIVDEFKQFYDSSFGYYGIYKVMYLTAPSTVVNAKLLSGSTYSSQGLELPYYYFKEPGIIFCAVLYPILISILTNQYVKRMLRGNYVESACYFWILNKLFSAVVKGDFVANLLDVENVAVYLFLVLIWIIKLRRNNRGSSRNGSVFSRHRFFKSKELAERKTNEWIFRS